METDGSLAEASRGEFEQVVLPHLDAAYTVARYLLRDEQAAGDAVQEAFLRAVRHYDGYRGDNARAWLLTIVRNCCATTRARGRAESVFVSFDEREHGEHGEEPAQELELARSSAAGAVRAALDALPPDAREVLVLRELDGMSYREISLIVGTPIGTVMSRLARARKRVQDLLRRVERDG